MENGRLNYSQSIYDLSKEFSLGFYRFIKSFKITQYNKHIVSQVLRASSSVGANIREAKNASSKKDLIQKLTLALKEADETEYWIVFLKEEKIFNSHSLSNLEKDLSKIIAILTSSIRKLKSKL